MTRADVISRLRKEQGKLSLRSYAKAIGCSAPYLSDVYLGRREPGPKILDRFNLECQVVVTKTYIKKRREL